MDSSARHGLRRARVYPHIPPSNRLENRSGVEGRSIESGIAMYGGYPEELDARILRAEQEGIGILGCGKSVAVPVGVEAGQTSCPVSLAMSVPTYRQTHTDTHTV